MDPSQTFPEITNAQERALGALARLLQDNPAPSIEEWGEAAGKHYSTMRDHRRALEAAELVYQRPGAVRSLRLTALGEAYVQKRALLE